MKIYFNPHREIKDFEKTMQDLRVAIPHDFKEAVKRNPRSKIIQKFQTPFYILMFCYFNLKRITWGSVAERWTNS